MAYAKLFKYSVRFIFLQFVLTSFTIYFFDNYLEYLKEIKERGNNFFINLLTNKKVPLKIQNLYNNYCKINNVEKGNLKLDILKSKTGFKTEKIHELFRYLSLVSKHFIFSLAAAGIICNLLKYIFGVSRPKYFFLQNYERINFFNLEHKANSFPSGHTQAAFTIAILLMIYLNRYYIIILIVASLMALSRIFMSMHFPSDLIAGAYVGSIVPYLLYKSIFMERIESIKKTYQISFKDLLKLMYWRLYI